MNENFYLNLKEIGSLLYLSRDEYYKSVPEDWFVVVSDVVGSTKAIETGKYKEVNMIGALSIVSILNIDRKLDIPFIFGGDGSFLLIPKSIYENSKQSLLAIKKIAEEVYFLDLRIGIIPIKDIYNAGKKILVSKYLVSEDYSQALIKGGGLEFSDKLLKSHNSKYLIKDKIDPNFILDIEGLECRWKSIKTPKDENLSILIKAKDENDYEKILNDLDEILGNNILRHPIIEENLELSFDDKDLSVEASLYTKNSFKKLFLLAKLKIINILGAILIKNKISFWSSYKQRIISTTDTEKFDDMLRMIVATSFTQTKKLEEYLEKEFANKKLIYGIHKSNSSLMTCLIFERHGKHIHFIDGSNGGYSAAAKELKSRLDK
ncbi:MAG: hypothetical protein C0625_10640 [Arcobacter sp.]|nr:MAG: hypothetical protein C0625_10640 [Arcobacter sp.]